MIDLEALPLAKIVDKLADGPLDDYLAIQDRMRRVDVTADEDFQKLFARFYRLRLSGGAEHRAEYFSLLESAKTRPLSFQDALFQLHERIGQWHASFASKLVATLDPHVPPLDSVVLGHLGIRLPYHGAANRGERIVEAYQGFLQKMEALLEAPSGPLVVDNLAGAFPCARVTPMKWLDFALWQTR